MSKIDADCFRTLQNGLANGHFRGDSDESSVQARAMVAHFIQGKWHGRDPMTHANYLDKLRVIHKSEHFLAVNKHPDLVINTNPPDNRWVLSLIRGFQGYIFFRKG